MAPILVSKAWMLKLDLRLIAPLLCFRVGVHCRTTSSGSLAQIVTPKKAKKSALPKVPTAGSFRNKVDGA